MYKVWTDSSIAPFNPMGILTWAFIVKLDGKIVHQDTEIIGWGKKEHTNNLGEATAVLKALEWLVMHLPKSNRKPVIINSDSNLIVNQCSESWQCKEPSLKVIVDEVLKLKRRYGKSIIFKWIPREENTEADELSRSLYTDEAIEIMKANETNLLHDWDDIRF
jgi:ribonuclease HI